ncbi:MAG: hypothetical protein II411_05740 [Lachnospiraceae bacterium]|nr:hypothetical protein [Lachnospiraceae bacterium]
MRKQIRKIIYFIIVLILAGSAYGSLSNGGSKRINDSNITYLLNTRTKKVHSKDCGVGKRSKEKNKQLKTDSLANIVKDGYTICGDCNAGVRKSFLTNIFNRFSDTVNVDYDDIILPTKEEYLEAVEEIGEWYVDHIPTYCRKLQEEDLQDYNGIDKNVDSIKLKSKNQLINKTKEYKYITSKETNITIYNMNSEDKILRANEKAVMNYDRYYDNVTKRGGILQYPCEYIEYANDYNKAGDDCVRYVFTVLNSIDPQFVSRIAKTSKYQWSNINTKLLYKDTDRMAKSLLKNGFEIFDSTIALQTKEITIEQINKEFKLEKGDIICRNGHVHIYIGNNGKDNFGWGKVNRLFPAYYTFSVINTDNVYKIKMEKGGDEELYTRVYRYKGGNIE